jgi:hypothetical protein
MVRGSTNLHTAGQLANDGSVAKQVTAATANTAIRQHCVDESDVTGSKALHGHQALLQLLDLHQPHAQ